MKKVLVLGLAVLSFQALADVRVGITIPGKNGGRDDLPMCLKNLDNANRRINDLQSQLISCQNSSKPGGGREVEELRRENRRLNDTVDRLNSDNRSLSESISRLNFDNNNLLDSNNRLIRENMDLRRQIDDMQAPNRSLGFFSYAGCKDYGGNVELKQIQSAEGRVPLEAETNATQKVSSTFSCLYGIKVAKTEEILTNESRNYCVAACKDYGGNVDAKTVKSGMGRNQTEAQYNAMKEVARTNSCLYGIRIQACQ
ncbi:hypothetical protein DOM21_18075 [Bacteriovorax stolpii]|uniref:Uncharacterized protein n=1 Tax=Bacteriovorax stolpii TaxID=960 RepID=A0A2K9NNU1_BACTC|nr:hypothetical protein [Bacteriovorax stolpii]AUN96745.1 hypothetical protein C0V70_01200 [Bacteriovorax stolpii]QDK43324.1 hypothetical protein DOM21_18075 [Bacteriovorax stolpii]TDP53731.1 hypothetical protein C8D79_1007 [Bacteriovorax stolpii]